jgi:UDP-glucose 4-epimerase
VETIKKIIITGGAGFIGLNLANELAKKSYQVIIWDNLSRGKHDTYLKNLLKKKNVKFIKKDLTKTIKGNISNVSHIFHLAGSVGVKNINKNPYKSFLNNFLSLKNVIDFNINLKKTAKLILFSTSEVYSNLIKQKLIKFPIKESNDIIIENSIIGRDAYFLSKIFNEKFLQLSNLNYLILRPHNIYGPRMGYSHVIPELTKKMLNSKKNKTIEIFSPTHKRAFCYIDDAIHQIIELSMKKKNNKKIFNIGNMSEEIKMIEVAKKIKLFLRKNLMLKKGNVTEGSPVRRIPNMSKTLKEIKSKKFVSLNEGLKITLNWYKKIN